MADADGEWDTVPPTAEFQKRTGMSALRFGSPANARTGVASEQSHFHLLTKAVSPNTCIRSGRSGAIFWPRVIPFLNENRAFHPGGMTANSRGLSGAIPPENDQIRPAPRRGASKLRLHQKSSRNGMTCEKFHRIHADTPQSFVSHFGSESCTSSSLPNASFGLNAVTSSLAYFIPASLGCSAR